MSQLELVQRLMRLDTCAVSDALDKLRLEGVIHGLRAFGSSRRVAGRVITVELQRVTPELTAARDAAGKPARHLATAAVEAAGPGDIIAIANGGGPDIAGWGGILSLGASLRGVSGVLVDGACRDVDEAVQLDLPLYARSAVPTTARGRIVETAWNEPIRFGPLTVAPGDLVIADGSGVVFLAAEHANDIVDEAEAIVARERSIIESVRSGVDLSKAMGEAYEHLLASGSKS